MDIDPELTQETAQTNISRITAQEQISLTSRAIQIMSEKEFDFPRIEKAVDNLEKLVQETGIEEDIFSILRSFQIMKESDNGSRYAHLSMIENCLAGKKIDKSDPLDLLLIKILNNRNFDSNMITKFLSTEEELNLSNSICILESLKNTNGFGLFLVLKELIKEGRQDIVKQIYEQSNGMEEFMERYL